MSATRLLLDLKAAGLPKIVEEPGWRTRGGRWAVDGEPEGIMEHHTAPPNPYPIKKLYGPPFYRTKANAATHEDGTLFLIAYRACNYSSGRGSRKVLTENVRKRIAPIHNATVRGLQGGNKHFWNIENSHPGDGSEISPIQLNTIVIATRIFADHFGLVSEQVISHASWTKRKIDPYWDGSNRKAITDIRRMVEEGGSVPVPPPSDDWTKELMMSLPMLRQGDGFSSGSNPQYRDDVRRIQANVAIDGIMAANTFDPQTGMPDGLFGKGTNSAVRGFQSKHGLVVDGLVGEKTWTVSMGQPV